MVVQLYLYEPNACPDFPERDPRKLPRFCRTLFRDAREVRCLSTKPLELGSRAFDEFLYCVCNVCLELAMPFVGIA